MVKVIVIQEDGEEFEISLDFDPKKHELYDFFKSSVTFIGQLVDTDIVIVKSVCGEIRNQSILPHPFHTEEVHGPIVLIRMDQNAEPQDLSLAEYTQYRRERLEHIASIEQNELLECQDNHSLLYSRRTDSTSSSDTADSP